MLTNVDECAPEEHRQLAPHRRLAAGRGHAWGAGRATCLRTCAASAAGRSADCQAQSSGHRHPNTQQQIRRKPSHPLPHLPSAWALLRRRPCCACCGLPRPLAHVAAGAQAVAVRAWERQAFGDRSRRLKGRLADALLHVTLTLAAGRAGAAAVARRCGERAGAALLRLPGQALQQALRVCCIGGHLEHVLSNGGARWAGQAVPFEPGLSCRAGRNGRGEQQSGNMRGRQRSGLAAPSSLWPGWAGNHGSCSRQPRLLKWLESAASSGSPSDGGPM